MKKRILEELIQISDDINSSEMFALLNKDLNIDCENPVNMFLYEKGMMTIVSAWLITAFIISVGDILSNKKPSTLFSSPS